MTAARGRADRAAARRALRSFDGSGVRVQAFLLARLFVAPLGPMDRELRDLRGRVLSLGCGHGVVDRYLAEINADVTVEGIDLDQDRVAVAQRTGDAAPRVSARVADVRLLAEGGYDAAIAIDVFHHIPATDHREVSAALLRQLRPGGRLLVKEMGATPRRQHLWNRFHDRLVAGPEPIACRDPDDMADVLEREGFEVTAARRLRRLGLYPQYLVVAERPAGST